MTQSVLIRCDANEQIGAGHFMRCLALAQVLRDQNACVHFVMADPPPSILDRLREAAIDVCRLPPDISSEEDALELTRLIESRRAAAVVLDGYSFSSDYHDRIARITRLVVIDDNGHLPAYGGHVIVNPNVHAHDICYRWTHEPGHVLSGTRFGLLRSEFRGDQPREAEPDGLPRVLLTFGGSDPCRLSEMTLAALTSVSTQQLQVTLLVGGNNPRLESLKRLAAESPHEVEVSVDVRNVASLMCQADIAVSAAGSTCAEMARVGLPALLIAAADNQCLAAARWDELGSARYLGLAADCTSEFIAREIDKLLTDPGRRERYSQTGQTLVDGLGAQRVAKFIAQTALSKHGNKMETEMAEEQYDVVRDEKWGYRRLEPIPATGDLNHFYESQYYDLIRKGGRAPELRRLTAKEDEANGERNWLHQTLYGDIAHTLQQTIPGGHVLDVGCGTGELMRFLAKNGFQVSGTEPSNDAAAAAKEAGLNVHPQTLEEFQAAHLESGAELFDAVVLINVLEHVPDPANIVAICRSLVRPGGSLCIRVPNDFTEIQQAAASAEQMDRWWVAVPDHINYFDFASLRALLNQLEMEVTHEQGDFPMELFLLMGDNYVTTPEKGPQCHERRVHFETSLPVALRRRIYSALAHEGVGRNCLTFATRKAA